MEKQSMSQQFTMFLVIFFILFGAWNLISGTVLAFNLYSHFDNSSDFVKFIVSPITANSIHGRYNSTAFTWEQIKTISKVSPNYIRWLLSSIYFFLGTIFISVAVKLNNGDDNDTL